MKFKAEMGHWSSVVGNSVHLIGEDGRFLGQIAIMCQDDRLREKDVQSELCEKICAALNADLCASGQVRALEVDDLAQIIRVVDGNNTLGAGELAEAILEAMPAPRIVGTPAPSAATPTAQEAVPSALRYVPTVTTDNCRTQPAQEAVPVAWRYRYVDPVSGKPIWRYSNNLWNGQRPSESQPLYAHPPQPSVSVAEAEIELLKADIESLTASLAAEVSESEKLRAEIERLTKALTEAANQISDLATRLGRAEGRLVASELVGVVEGWKARAEKAEAERDEARAQVAAAFEAAARRTDSGDVEYPSGVIDMEGEELREILRALTPADAQAALEAYGREKVREGMRRAADIARTTDEDDDQLDRQCRIIVAAQILAAMEKEGGE